MNTWKEKGNINSTTVRESVLKYKIYILDLNKNERDSKGNKKSFS